MATNTARRRSSDFLGMFPRGMISSSSTGHFVEFLNKALLFPEWDLRQFGLDGFPSPHF